MLPDPGCVVCKKSTRFGARNYSLGYKVQWLLWVGSGYRQLQAVKFRYPPESGYSPGTNFNEAYSRNRPDAAVREIRKTPPQAGLFNEHHHSNERLL